MSDLSFSVDAIMTIHYFLARRMGRHFPDWFSGSKRERFVDLMGTVLSVILALPAGSLPTPSFEMRAFDPVALEGYWQIIDWEYRGHSYRKVYRGTYVHFEGNKVTFPINDRLPTRFRLDLSAGIPRIDIKELVFMPWRGIIDLRNNTLTLCLAGNAKERPIKFEAQEEQEIILIKLERAGSSAPASK
jgi:uncharacterized protein (TIGR03067 family)